MMDKKISLIIPAKDEAENIGHVLKVATRVKEIDEIIVIADACTDNTAKIARKFKVKVYEKKKTKGKGDAMFYGAGKSKSDILLFIDADLKNLKISHIKSVLLPVTEGGYQLSIGLRDRAMGLGVAIPKMFNSFAISGERAMTRSFFNSLPKSEDTDGFGIEIIMNRFAKINKVKIAYPVLTGLNHTIKEKKWGLARGLSSRLLLIYQIIKSQISVRIK